MLWVWWKLGDNSDFLFSQKVQEQVQAQRKLTRIQSLPMEWEKLAIQCPPDKELISNMYKVLAELNTKIRLTPSKNGVKR